MEELNKLVIVLLSLWPSLLLAQKPGPPINLVIGPQSADDSRYCTINEVTQFPGGATTDGPATLIKHCVYTAMSATPSNGTVLSVAVGDAAAFQTALNNAACGDTIALAAGSTYTGSFTFPSKPCDRQHYITIRTNRMDLLPTEGKRALPCDANVQLPNRPPYPGPGNCRALVAAMPKIVGNGTLDETFRMVAGVHDYRLIGLEIQARPVARTAQVQNVINIQPSTGSDHIIIDRCWVHGTPDQSLVRGVFMQDGLSFFAIINSSFTDIHCLNGVCTDSQMAAGGLGSQPKTAFKGVNNYVESAGTNSMTFGGGSATLMPTDWEWRRNYQVNPWSWDPACTGSPLPVSCSLPGGTPVAYDGLGPYSTKNCLEVKNIIGALIEGNVMMGKWQHADQNASCLVFTPKNQAGNQCPLCTELDIVARYNHIISTGGFLQAVNTSADDGGLATQGGRYSIHDNLAEDLNHAAVTNVGFNFTTFGFQTWSSVTLPCTNSFVQFSVSIVHNTLVLAPNRNYNAMHQMDGPVGPCQTGMVFSSNLAFYGSQGVNQVSNSACAQATSTAFDQKYQRCWKSPFVMTGNGIIGGKGTWPAGNFMITDANAVQFVNYNNGLRGDYHLLPTSPLHHAAPDGKDVGADIDAVNAATQGVN